MKGLLYPPMKERPPYVRLNPEAQLARGAVFLGGGAYPGSVHYHDSSLYRNHGVLTDMDPKTDWVFDGELRR